MNNIYFKYNNHPGDFFRNTDITNLPNLNEDLESFLIQFLHNYQSDEKVALLNDLYKLLYDEFYDIEDKNEVINQFGTMSKNELITEIALLETNLKEIALENFYYLILNKKIKIIENGEE